MGGDMQEIVDAEQVGRLFAALALVVYQGNSERENRHKRRDFPQD